MRTNVVRIIQREFAALAADLRCVARDSVYGYWIDDKGKLIEVDYEGHIWAVKRVIDDALVQKALKRRPRGGLESAMYDAAYESGWVKITGDESTEGDFGIAFWKHKVSDKALATFRKLIAKSSVRNYYGDVYTTNKYGQVEQEPFTFHNAMPRYAIDFVTSVGKKTLLDRIKLTAGLRVTKMQHNVARDNKRHVLVKSSLVLLRDKVAKPSWE